VTKITKR
jgi:hypothetical protein